MENNNVTFNELEKETFLLVEQYIQLMRLYPEETVKESEQNGTIFHLERIKKIIENHAIRRIQNEKEAKLEKARELKRRKQVECPECHVANKVKIVEKAYNEQFDWEYDVFKCKNCGHQFASQIPNNNKDKIALIQRITELYIQEGKNGESLIQKSLNQNQPEILISFEEGLAIKKSLTAVVEAEKALKECMEQAEQNFLSIHHKLWMDRLRLEYWNRTFPEA